MLGYIIYIDLELMLLVRGVSLKFEYSTEIFTIFSDTGKHILSKQTENCLQVKDMNLLVNKKIIH